MRCAIPAFIAGLSLFSACTDKDGGITAFNASPVATITSHASGITLEADATVTFRGSVSDPDDDNANLLVTWYLGDAVACEEVNAEVDGTTSCDIAPKEGDDQISVEVRDPYGAADSALITFTVIATDAPVVEITSPDSAGKFYELAQIEFEGTVTDTEDDNATLEAIWESSLDGVLDADSTPDSDGNIVGFDELSEGSHVITLTRRIHQKDGKG